MTKTYKFHAKCSQCGRAFRSNTQADILRLTTKHAWRKHPDWMRRRIKGGLKKRKLRPTDNPHWLQALLGGTMPVANLPQVVEQYRGMSTSERMAAKTLLRTVGKSLGGEGSIVVSLLINALDMTVES